MLFTLGLGDIYVGFGLGWLRDGLVVGWFVDLVDEQ